MKITNLGHACFQINSENGIVVFDPYENGSVPGLTFPKDIVCDECFISHDHLDHCAINNVRVTHSNKINFEILEIPHDKESGAKRGMNKIHIVYLEGKKIVHLGDIGVVDKTILEKIGGCDLLFAPINGFFTISADEAKEVFDIVKPRIIIPMHYENRFNHSGYPDGGQINRFLELFPRNLKVKNTSIDLAFISKKTDAIIFDNYLSN